MTRERMTRFRPYVTEVFVTRGARHARCELLILPNHEELACTRECVELKLISKIYRTSPKLDNMGDLSRFNMTIHGWFFCKGTIRAKEYVRWWWSLWILLNF